MVVWCRLLALRADDEMPEVKLYCFTVATAALTSRVSFPHVALQSENNPALEHMHAIARMFVNICEDEADAYWLTLRFLATNQLALILAEPVVCGETFPIPRPLSGGYCCVLLNIFIAESQWRGPHLFPLCIKKFLYRNPAKKPFLQKTTGVRIYRHVTMLSKLAWIEDAGLCTHLNRLDVSMDQFAFRYTWQYPMETAGFSLENALIVYSIPVPYVLMRLCV